MRFWLAVPALLLLAPACADAKKVSITLVAVGDVGFNRHSKKVYPDGMLLWGKKKAPFKALFKDKTVRKYITGDIRFCNLETVITKSNDILPDSKKYNFRSHPNAIPVLQRAGRGFNLLSIANNHIHDFGAVGIAHTPKWLRHYNKKGKRRLWFAGAGKNLHQASRATVMKIRGGVRVAFAAVSIGRTVANPKKAGAAPTHRPNALVALKKARADIRILSMHAGTERALKPVGYQRSLAHRAIKNYKVDIVIGHHPHVVQGIERFRGGVIFYSLGNFALRGARDMGKIKKLKGKGDYGLLVKLVMSYDKRRKKLRFKVLEALPVYDMHSGPHPFKKQEQAWARVKYLNTQSAVLPKKKNPKVEFVKSKGRYLHYFKK